MQDLDRGLRQDYPDGELMQMCYNCGGEMIEAEYQHECGCGAIVPKFVSKICPLTEEYCMKNRCMWFDQDKNCCLMWYLPRIWQATNIIG